MVESLCADLDDLGEPVTWQNHAPAPVSCRPNEIRRAVRNLVENAVAYGAKADVQIAARSDGYDIVIEDEGPGIPDDDRVRVFEPFVRLESSRNAATGGTGLGLTLAKAIAEGHGGAIVLENKPRGGLRARMHLPRIGGGGQEVLALSPWNSDDLLWPGRPARFWPMACARARFPFARDEFFPPMTSRCYRKPASTK